MVAVGQGIERQGFLPTLLRVSIVMGAYLALEWWIMRAGTPSAHIMIVPPRN